MTLEEFQIDIYGIVTEVATAVANFLDKNNLYILDGLDALLEAISTILSVTEYVLGEVQDAVCDLAGG
ncbi:hypothetical protein KIH27_10720 [Mycobacterium sp. M1]|uniref:Uncharacterized protein n=1 Tax=Mycolicibacter acidiphilus TaxID=2835306 RepID=A0ABS5RIH1_9MYCO|nr:hypothetical protein [Mycolicibacter acidiphilus]MBS9534056.1 hypothetical protein [Mycolicibacter acidiphilus]